MIGGKFFQSNKNDSLFTMKLMKSGKSNVVSCPIKFNGDTHYIYFKKHTGKLFKKQNFTSEENKKEIRKSKGEKEEIDDEIEQFTRERTIFVSNIPFHSTEEDLTKIFSVYGKVKDVRIGNTITEDEKKIEHLGKSSFSEIKQDSMLKSTNAHILFEDEASVEKSLNSKVNIDVKSTKTTKNGLESKKFKKFNILKEYLEIYKSQMLDPKKDFKMLNNWMKDFDEKVLQEEKLIEIIQNEPDEDGFVKILPKNGKRFQTPLKLQDFTERKKKKDVVEIPFYKFQRIEKQMSKMETLRDQFEKDKEKIERLKNHRKFKP
jgi:ribosomal RNA-processing protein 7